MNITELAQSLKAAAEKASNGDWVKESGDGWEACCSANDQANGGFIIAHFVGPDAAENREFVQAANPANVLALVEALEKSEKTSEARREAIGITHKRAARERDRANAAEEALEKAQAQSSKWLEAYHKAVSIGARYEERIAELESRTVTVKLPPKIERNDADGWFMYNCGRVGGGAAEWYNKALDDVGAELTAAGIKVEAE